MKYSNEVVIDLPRKKVIELFNSEENLFKWQPELLSFEHLSGERGEVGAKSKMQYKICLLYTSDAADEVSPV